MTNVTRLVLATLAVASHLVGANPMKDKCDSPTVGKAVYFITNDRVNSVAAVPISKDGKLYGGTLTPTAGKGSNLVDPDTMEPNKPDALASQSAVQVVGKYVFAVNPGSNSVSMLAISEHDPTRLRLVGKPAAVPGDFPNTVAASDKNKIVCVATTGTRAGVSCASYGERGIGDMDDLRPFETLEQSNPPTGPTNTVSQVLWSDDETALLVMVKGQPMEKEGYVAVFPVESMGSACGDMTAVSAEGVRSSPNGTVVLFGSEPIAGTDNIFFTDASFGGGILELHDDQTVSLVARQPIDGQQATCWSAISPLTGTAFVTDVLVSRVVEMDLGDAKIVSELDTAATGASGFTDLRVAGKFVYLLAPQDGKSEARIVVVKADGRGKSRVVQTFKLGRLGAGANSQGMAVTI